MKFHTAKTVLESLTCEKNATNINYFDNNGFIQCWLGVGLCSEKPHVTSSLKMLPSAGGFGQHFQDLGHTVFRYTDLSDGK